MNIADLREALQSTNAQAFLRVIRAGESHESNDESFAALYGWHPGNGLVFVDFTDHPRRAFKSPWGWTSAAGAYQAMCAVPGQVKTDTWGDFVRWCATQDYRPLFGQADQNIFAAWCINRRGALADVLAGRLDEAIAKCGREWASLPGAPYGQPVMTMGKAREVWLRWGGADQGEPIEPAPIPTQPPAARAPPEPAIPVGEAADWPFPETNAPHPTPEKTMPAPIIAAVIPGLLSGLANTLIDAFTAKGRDSVREALTKHGGDPAAAGQIIGAVVDAAKAVTGKADPIEAIVAAKADPAVAMKQIEASTMDTLERMAPLLEKLAEWERKDWDATEASRDAAGKRARSEAYDMTFALMVAAFAGVGLITLTVTAIAVIQALKIGKVDSEILFALSGLIGWMTAKAGTIYDYRFGGVSRTSAAMIVRDEFQSQPRAGAR